jgi:cysteine synthase A
LESPTLSTGYKTGTHRIQGISDEFIPTLVNLSMLDEILQTSDCDSIHGTELAKQIGIATSISSGANIIGAVQVNRI